MSKAGNSVVLEINPTAVRRRRRVRFALLGMALFGVLFLLVLDPILSVVFFPGQGPLPGDPLRWYAGMALPSIVLAGGEFLHLRPAALAVNRVAVAEGGIYPPFKPKRRLSRGEWFVSYRDIASMNSIESNRGLASAYQVTLRDGFVFQMNAMDLLLYVDERTIREFMRTVAVIRSEVEDPANQARAARGEDIVIPRERFAQA